LVAIDVINYSDTSVCVDSEDCDNCDEILEELETIDDDTDKHGIQFVKSKDSKLASDIGIFSFPALVYYETGVPIMYDGKFIVLFITLT
jgi:thiol-disulfide isomerase/thioredoxin